MKNLIQITTVLFLAVQTMMFSQVDSEITSEKQIQHTELETTNLQDFIGVYFLAEADFNLEIIQEDGDMYIISPFDKDILVQTKENTLHEPIRGVDLTLLDDDKSALKYNQNGYETMIKRVEPKTEK